MDNKKIYTIDGFAETLNHYRSQNKKIVHAHGVFDLLHIGHIRHFQEAKKLGDILVVTVTPDAHVNRGPNRPVFTEELRCEAIAALDCVDYVLPNPWPTAIETIRIIRPDYFVKGDDYKDTEKYLDSAFSKEVETVNSLGGQVVFTGDPIYSSSHLVNHHLSLFSKEVSDYLKEFSLSYHEKDVLGYLEAISTMKILTLGETIIDEYVYCETIGKSGKEPILASKYISEEKFAGGILAIANNLGSLSDHVKILTLLGKQDSHEEFIIDNLKPNIELEYLELQNSPTILKRRFAEMYPFQKLFEIYKMGLNKRIITESKNLCTRLEEILPEFDVVIVADYGHGMINAEEMDLLCSKARFLAVNTQLNAANHGFNTISKYNRADYICISEREIRMDARNHSDDDIKDIIARLSSDLECERITITQGTLGSLSYHTDEGFFTTPSFTSKIVDRVGAGDTVFAVTAPCAALGIPTKVLGFIGNVVGAQAVSIVGHRESIERTPLYKYIGSLMK